MSHLEVGTRDDHAVRRDDRARRNRDGWRLNKLELVAANRGERVCSA